MSTEKSARDREDTAGEPQDGSAPAPGKRARTDAIGPGAPRGAAATGGLPTSPVQAKADPFDFSYARAAGQVPALQRKEPAATATAAAVTDPFPGEKLAAAKSFAALVDLVTLAETRLAAAGHDTASVVHILRGIFYGTKWSMDNQVEGSEMRNVAFQIYTASMSPDDPRPIIGTSLFLALRGSAEVKDPNGRYTDFGHLIIGLDSRDWVSRTVNIPSQGGTGQAINTWLGDLGGGAGMLAMNRGLDGNVTKHALRHFKGSDYGGVVNLEGDIAGVVGVELRPGQTLADALRAYLLPPKEDTASRWNRRAQLMLESLGGTVVAGAVTGEAALIAQVGAQIEGFSCWYAATRLKDKGKTLTPAMCRDVGHHITGAAAEMAEILVKTLVWAMADPKRNIDAQLAGCDPAPTAASTAVPYQLEAVALSLEAAATGADWSDKAADWADEQRKKYGF